MNAEGVDLDQGAWFWWIYSLLSRWMAGALFHNPFAITLPENGHDPAYPLQPVSDGSLRPVS